MKKLFAFLLAAMILTGGGCGGSNSDFQSPASAPTAEETQYEYLWLFPKEYQSGDVYDTSGWETLSLPEQKFKISLPASLEAAQSPIDPIIEGAANGLIVDLDLFIINVQDDPLGLSAAEAASQLWPEAEIIPASKITGHPIAGELLKKYPDLDMVYVNNTSDTNEYEGLQLNQELCVNKNGKLYFFIINKEGIITLNGYENSLKFVVSQMQTFEFTK